MNNGTYQPQQLLSESKIEHAWHTRSVGNMKERNIDKAFIIANIITSFMYFRLFYIASLQ